MFESEPTESPPSLSTEIAPLVAAKFALDAIETAPP